ncbi:hypothetical protein SLNWT_1026 [Streptomyces albus]|uniref:Uncharacterized protein n=1 Tax=Streptomyces albus (strain ATCC 21838 / DSM 41398 / FERM P-419 / JCM 4703 / NBRC 107858) TaxID=1081613 RepID=A0A0B5ETH4_STRA4|nr:hypothetical protein SLNWT_1026 [Streptomyces albus]AOU75718.1 hypothetical protein SLNHY_1027 [Streptomyces albus]AYN31518.1 hypothetical protein DUI70_1016 [Streptomyces albus]
MPSVSQSGTALRSARRTRDQKYALIVCLLVRAGACRG